MDVTSTRKRKKMKKQIQIIAIVLILPILGLSQNKFSFGVNANSEISLMSIKNAQSASGIEEKGGLGLGYSFGIQAQYRLNEKMFLRSGIFYELTC